MYIYKFITFMKKNRVILQTGVAIYLGFCQILEIVDRSLTSVAQPFRQTDTKVGLIGGEFPEGGIK